MTYTDLKTIFKDFKKNPKQVLLLLFIVAVITISSISPHLSLEWSNTNYAPQSTEKSPGSIQVQGNDNVVFGNGVVPPELTYQVTNPSHQAYGKYYASFVLFVSHPRVGISPGYTIKFPKGSICAYSDAIEYSSTTTAYGLSCESYSPLNETPNKDLFTLIMNPN